MHLLNLHKALCRILMNGRKRRKVAIDTNRIDGRENDELRIIEGIADFQTAPEGSVYLKWGQTHVICSGTIEERVPTSTGQWWRLADG